LLALEQVGEWQMIVKSFAAFAMYWERNADRAGRRRAGKNIASLDKPEALLAEEMECPFSHRPSADEWELINQHLKSSSL
jgi:hypothetical protein